MTGRGVVSSSPRYHRLGAVSFGLLISVTHHKKKVRVDLPLTARLIGQVLRRLLYRRAGT